MGNPTEFLTPYHQLTSYNKIQQSQEKNAKNFQFIIYFFVLFDLLGSKIARSGFFWGNFFGKNLTKIKSDVCYIMK